jgi:hypothetical protein
VPNISCKPRGGTPPSEQTSTRAAATAAAGRAKSTFGHVHARAFEQHRRELKSGVHRGGGGRQRREADVVEVVGRDERFGEPCRRMIERQRQQSILGQMRKVGRPCHRSKRRLSRQHVSIVGFQRQLRHLHTGACWVFVKAATTHVQSILSKQD